MAGSVRNRPDGTVEAVFEGERDDVEALVELCREGPPRRARGARRGERGAAEGLSGFEVA